MTPSGQTSWNFAGRQRELADLKAALYSAVAGQGQLVMLAGEQAGHPDKTAEYNAKANASRSRR
ncbi:hypothetical protein MGWOODY_Clf1471 [hydrothermal vent metagenome]|uniref:Uncharacterized protein n=1 Tax=hydrothermal vent metagenome TaxID=652676 RepID=A0A160VA31_9ZZZZ